ncbi:MAG: 1-acyl-sn-glycerol-3-phosphate acyltransferase [Bdellovibrionota bacterium]|jgi:hypothetical protein|nr:1-acyl-sn-glycerol-3-phosphate acyltransferase [Bdellovibrionota bacterium]
MKYLFSLTIALAVKVFSKLFYQLELKILNPTPDFWENINVFAFLNHTSLFEPLLFSSLPNHFYFNNIHRAVLPGADITLERPIVGKIYKVVFPQIISITRKRDSSWNDFMDKVKKGSLIVIAPEGRMMRPNGLDKHGNPMTIKSGIADILLKTDSGYLLLGYSGGLHHVQSPGERKLRLFKTLEMTYERVSIAEYKEKLRHEEPGFHRRVVEDLTQRLEKVVPNRRDTKI